jgi:SAM-dependent methyltransferase
MNPQEVGQSYDAIAPQWKNPKHPLTGLPQHERAIRFLTVREHALDVGCGCNGRFIELFKRYGFAVEGVDVSGEMIAIAKELNPDILFHHADICSWTPPRKYDLITAWDSVWHVPLNFQENVLKKLSNALKPGGVLVFTMGGVDEPAEVVDAHMGVPMYTATLGIPKTLKILDESGCICRHLEYDQYPELHVSIIAQKTQNLDLNLAKGAS